MIARNRSTDAAASRSKEADIGAPVIRLLGTPEIILDGEPLPPPQGRKTWAVLAYLLLAGDRPTRSRLADLFFPDADDPRAALRWTLTDLRHLLDGVATITRDPVQLELPEDAVVDAWQVLEGSGNAESAALRGELLEGMSFRSSEPLERWLAAERDRVALTATRILSEAAQAARDAGDPARAADLEAHLVALDPYSRPDDD